MAKLLPAFLTIALAAVPAAAETGPAPLADLDALVAVCEAAVPAGRVAIEGNAFERGVRRAEHRRRRAEALRRAYRIELTNRSFDFLEYDPETEVLGVDSTRGLRVLGGRASLDVGPDEDLGFPIGRGEARRVVSLHERGRLRLVIDFFLAPGSSGRAPCSPTTRRSAPLTVQVQLVRAALLDDEGRPVATAEHQRLPEPEPEPGAEAPREPPGGPSATLTAPTVASGSGLDQALRGETGRALAEHYLACYRAHRTDAADPGGTVVVRLSVGRGGAVVAAHVEIDSLGDEGVAACLLERTRAAQFPSTAFGIVSQPVLFSGR